MKKVLLLLGGFLLTAASASAIPVKSQHSAAPGKYLTCPIPEGAVKPSKAPASRTETSFVYSLAQEPYSPIGFKGSMKGDAVAQALEIPVEITSSMSGNKLESVYFYTGINTTTQKNRITEATVFLTYDLEEEPFYSQTVTGLSTQPLMRVDVQLTTPQTIDGTKPLYVCVKSILTNSRDYPIVVDGVARSEYYGGWVANTNDGKLVWDNLSQYYGYVCMGATIKGDNFPVDFVSAGQASVLPVVTAGEPFSVYLLFNNNGINDVTSLEVEATVGNEASKVFTVQTEESVPFAATDFVQVDGLTYSKPGKDATPIKLKITKVNGNANKSSNTEVETSAIFIA